MVSNIETLPDTETGGVLLGFFRENTIEILEAIGPGPDAILETSHAKVDMTYINYSVQQLSNIYKINVIIVGLWHKHNNNINPPFSSEDIKALRSLREYCGNDIISLLFQYDADSNQYMLTTHMFNPDSNSTYPVSFNIGSSHNNHLYRYSMEDLDNQL